MWISFVYLLTYLLLTAGCINCDEIFSKLISFKRARLTAKRKPVPGGRGGRGRGGRGRGGRRPAKDKMSQLANYFV